MLKARRIALVAIAVGATVAAFVSARPVDEGASSVLRKSLATN